MVGDWDVRVEEAEGPLVWAPAVSRRERRAARKREQRRRHIRQGVAALGALLLVSGGVIATTSLIRSSAPSDAGKAADVAGTSVTRTSEGPAGGDPEVTPEIGTPASTDAPSTDAPSATTAPPAATTRSVRLMFSGDMIPHSPLVTRAKANGKASGQRYDFDPMLASVRPIISSADVAICHLETPVSPDDSKISGFPTFNAPVEFAQAIATAGYDGCSLASNHAMDAGRSGVGRTLDALDATGLEHAGTARSAEESASATVYVANGVKVAHLSYTYGLNGLKVPAGQPWLVNIIDPDRILAEARAAKAGGADVVVVSIHCCVEYQHAPAARQRELADPLLASPDIDLIVGHHAHVVQPIAKVDGKPVSYGLGNFLTNQSALCCVAESQDGMILDVTYTGTPGVGRFTLESLAAHPTWVDRDGGYVVIPIARALADPATPAAKRSLLERSMVRTTRELQSMGVPVDTSG